MSIPVTVWYGCYSQSWAGVLTDDCFKHPAKFSRALIQRILRHGLEKGYWKRGDRLGDPFGGVGCGGIEAAEIGFEWLGQELEGQFVKIGNENLAANAERWTKAGRPLPKLVQGDSRKFAESVSAILTSPPFTATRGGGGMGAGRHYLGQGGDRAPENIEKLDHGNVDGVLTSPPYETIRAGHGGLNHLPAKKLGQQTGRQNATSNNTSEDEKRYGRGKGQIARTKTADLSAVITSPPYADQDCNFTAGSKRVAWDKGVRKGMKNDGLAGGTYGKTDKANISNLSAIGKDAGETYWAAMQKVYSSCFQAIKAGGYMAVVVKDYVRKWKRVPLCDDTMRLLQHVGFEPVERIHAMVVEHLPHHRDMFTGDAAEPAVKTRKSFFRRLQEQRGAPPIDFEEVLIVRKPKEQK